LQNEYTSEGVVNYRTLLLYPAGFAVFGALLLLLFFFPPTTKREAEQVAAD